MIDLKEMNTYHSGYTYSEVVYATPKLMPLEISAFYLNMNKKWKEHYSFNFETKTIENLNNNKGNILVETPLIRIEK
jgi:hypothetical protein